MTAPLFYSTHRAHYSAQRAASSTALTASALGSAVKTLQRSVAWLAMALGIASFLVACGGGAKAQPAAAPTTAVVAKEKLAGAQVAKQPTPQKKSTEATLRPFITKWKTDNPGASSDNEIRIGTAGGGYMYAIDWGDGSSDVSNRQ